MSSLCRATIEGMAYDRDLLLYSVLKAWISRRIGGDQIDHAEEVPEIRRTFAEALRRTDSRRGVRGEARRPATGAGTIGGRREVRVSRAKLPQDSAQEQADDAPLS